MALIDILSKIKKESSANLKKVEKEFKEKKSELEKEYKGMHKGLEQDMKNRFAADSEKIKERANLEAEMDAKNDLLRAKRKLIDAALKKAVEELSRSERYTDILVEMLKKVDIEASAEIVPARGKEDATRSAIERANKGFSVSGQSADISGGFILKTDIIEIDNSFETIVNEQLRPTLEIELNKLLFS